MAGGDRDHDRDEERGHDHYHDHYHEADGGHGPPLRPEEALERLRASTTGAGVSSGLDLLNGDDGFGARLLTFLVAQARRSPLVALAAVAALVVTLVAAVGLWLWWERSSDPAPGAFVPADSPLGTIPIASPTTTIPEPSEVIVHAAGAVVSPGVYRMDPTARVGDLVTAAGGLAPDADPDRVNLAGPLADGAKVHIPRQGESVPPGDGAGGEPLVPGGSGGAAGPGVPSEVDINTAAPDALQQLPGVGPATASAIIEHRQRNGPFRSVDDLIDVSGIGPAKLERLRSLVRV